MRIVTGDEIPDLISQAADQVEQLVRANPQAVIGIATGSSPEPLYVELTRRAQAGLDLSQLRITCLDEYIGLPAEHVQSYRHYITEQILTPWNIDPAHAVLPEGDAADPDAAAAAFEEGIGGLGGIDLQILGIGPNGHIAFNEPGSPFDSRTRVVDLTADTREANSRFFDSIDEVPRQALTQGIGTILESRSAIMLAFGEAKAEAVAAMIDGPVDENVPASALQRHPALEVFLDAAAASRLGNGGLRPS
ncbi:glucosamine-6-phosphate deaminase [Brevibacterium otitidis]|uniref:Glucosamine-6-phosphate deaminase n=1 Tax=Brevibacterium otitidis TaxID=53364 RepID=A0ABV5X4X4_9MICO|nr:glucosamine-6-phosphate deaminase [Brevibacterium otitidis]